MLQMNIMRKLMGHVRPTHENAQQQSQDNVLGLMHLRKLFAEFCHPSNPIHPKEQEDKLYNMLPLFCKTFGSSPASDMTEKFGDCLQFCSHVSKLMVSEIRRRASNQSTEAASFAIVKFLEIESTEESSNGWMLLSTINLLAAGDASLIEVMTAASLPSTLVKCLYLFFDLPDVENGDVQEPDSEFTPRERRILLQKIFVQVLVRLCSHVAPAEELARKDDLTLLFSAITSWCPPHNVPWRKSAAEVLMTLSRHGLSPSVVTYIHNKACVGLCIDNMQRVQELSPLEIVEMFVTVFCFLKDSSEVSQSLMDDFRTSQGYIFLSEFLLRLEQDHSKEARDALRNLVLLVSSLTMCGFIELKPSQASTGSLFQIPGFSLPQPSGRGVSVRNVQAFQVLQSVFLKASSTHLCNTILDAIGSVYHSDNVNYFILEPQHTLSQFAEKIHTKPIELQQKFFGILEFIVFNLLFVPCKELISLSILLKTQSSVECSIICMKSLLKILRFHSIFKDVYREVGLLEVMVTCLHRYAILLKDPLLEAEGFKEVEVPEVHQTLGFLIMDALTLLLNSNSSNASIFRECGGARCAHNMVPYLTCRSQSLGIVQQLVLSNGGDDDMGTLLGMMHTAPAMALDLKSHILKSLLYVLRESHRTRTVFRRVGGFVYVMSVLVSMEGCLADPPKSPWENADRKQVISLLKTVFNTLTVAMRFEPANAKFFASEIRYTSLTETIRLLGCFSQQADVIPVDFEFSMPEEHVFQCIFSGTKESKLPADIPKTLISACLMLRFLYDMALDAFDRPGVGGNHGSPILKRLSSDLQKYKSPSPDSSPRGKCASIGSMPSLTLNLPTADPVIVHPGAVIAIIYLMPAIFNQSDKMLALTLQAYTSEIAKSLVRSERNQQVMCEAGLAHELLTHCSVALEDENHPLHPTLQYIFERLAAQSLEPKDLREFLRLGNPLNCVLIDDRTPAPVTGNAKDTANLELYTGDKTHTSNIKWQRTEGGSVPLTRVKTLVSMTTPRDFRLHGTSIMPPFVEFDMNAEGFGCLYLPSIAPQSASSPSVVGVGVVGGGTDTSVIGGIGTGDRIFPPQSGLSYSTWICVDKFSSPLQDPHPVRLLTLVRNMHGREEHLVCLSVMLLARDRALVISTQETVLPTTGGVDVEPEPVQNESTVRFWCPELIQGGQWHHIVLVLNRAVLKNSSVSLYVDGQHIGTQKLHYVSQSPGGAAANLAVAASVYGYIGTQPQLRRHSKLVWKQGPCHLFEEVLLGPTVHIMHHLGPNYLGSYQAPVIQGIEPYGALVAEDKVVLGLNVQAVSQLTISKIRKVYSKVDSKAIAKQLGLSSHENATPIRILHNSAGHLSGPARSLGGVLIGYLGVRTFCPKPVARTLENVGGTAALLGLIAMATDVEGLYAAVKALVCVVKSNRSAGQEMDRIGGYQTLAMLLKKKKHLLNSHILHLTFSLVGTIDSARESTVIPNPNAFSDLLCDLEVWHEAPGDLQRSLYEHFYELVTESSEQKNNVKLMRDLGLVSRLLHLLKDPNLSYATIQVVMNLLTALLQNTPSPPDLLSFGQFLVSKLPAFAVTEKHLNLNEDTNKTEEMIESGDFSGMVSVTNIQLRNRCLSILHQLVFTSNGSPNQFVCEEISRVLGFDWMLLFLQGHLHPSTIVLTMRILIVLLSNTLLMQRFREGSSNGNWLSETETVLQNRMGVLLGFNVGTSSNKSDSRELNFDACKLPGFQVLQWLLPKHSHIPELYYLLLALLLGQPVHDLPKKLQFDLDSVWSYMFGVPANQSVQAASKSEMCPDAALVILAMIRTMLNVQNPDEVNGAWLQEYPITLSQFLLFLYHNLPEFCNVCMTAEFLSSLSASLFPLKQGTDSGSGIISPVDDTKLSPSRESSKWQVPSGALTQHPAKKFVLDLLRVIIMDSFSMPLTSKSPPVVDLVLEAPPEYSSRLQQREFQTEILSTLMDQLLAADVLLGEQSALPIAAGGSYANIAANVFYFAGRVVDKLWQGVFVRDAHEVFQFIAKLISQAKRRSLGVSLDPIYHSLNRTILYQLSRPLESIPGKSTILDTLQQLTSNKSLVFGPGNYEQEFVGCLCFCLLQLTEDTTTINPIANNMDPNRKTHWHVPISSLDEGNTESEKGFWPISQQLQSHIVNAAKRVWEELYVCKKPTIEEVFKVSLTGDNSSPKLLTPDLSSVRPVIHEVASRLWQNYVENERKNSYKDPSQLATHLQSIQVLVEDEFMQICDKHLKKLQKLTRLTGRRGKKEVQMFRIPPTPMQQIQDAQVATFSHISIVKDLVEFQYKQYLQSHQHMQKYVFEEWIQTENELTRERGLWGPALNSKLDKWMLDSTEGPCRMRKKMMKNDIFYYHYPYRPEIEFGDSKALKYKMAGSYDSKEYYLRSCCLQVMMERESSPFEMNSLSIDEPQPEEEDREEIKEIPKEINLKSLPSKGSFNRTISELDDEPDGGDASLDIPQDGTDQPDNQSVLRLLEQGEKISHMFRCARIQGLDTGEGLLLFGKEHFYVMDGFTLLKTREIRDIDYLPSGLHDPIVPNTTKRTKSSQKRICSKFAYEDIREVHKRRYLLQPIALEVFSADGRNYLLAFPRKVRNKVYSRFLNVATAITDSAQQSVSGQKRSANVEPGAGLLSSLIGETSVTQRWVRGEISNFQYLMHLNTLAGRSYNDLMQYPVFPWILADYDVEELDLTISATFRDLSKPMGAQTPERLEQFQKRYIDWDDLHGETPPYHYGTHYSSAMIVASYLVRMEPFTQHFLRLQGGHFDLADRMFHSVKEAWLSSSKHNMADIKELIPEFFYLPEFLVNSNHFDLGCKQNGIPLNNVVLPPWAKSDPREFIRVHRQALECDYVSAHLNEWIDLIFGYKQSGPAAVEAINVFHHLFYEGGVDIYTIDDPLKKNATIGFINNFGQIPKQLFKKLHPAKKLSRSVMDSISSTPGISVAVDKLFFHNLDHLRPTMQPLKELKAAVGQIIHNDKAVLAVEQNKVLIPPYYSRYLAWGFADQSIRVGAYDSEKALFISENLHNGEILAAACPNSKLVITGGTSAVVNVWEFSQSKDKKLLNLKQNLYGHTEPVTCLAASPAYNVIVSGSRDRTCIIWDMSRLTYVRQLKGHNAPVAAVTINELTGDIATCASTYLHIWSINGDEIACVNTATGRNDRTQQILCAAMSQLNDWDPQNVIMTGSSDGVVRMWSVEFVQVPDEDKKPKREEIKETGEFEKKHHSSTESSSVIKTKEIVHRMSLVGDNDDLAEVNVMLRRMSLNQGVPPCSLVKSSSDSSLSEPEILGDDEKLMTSSLESESPQSPAKSAELSEGNRKCRAGLGKSNHSLNDSFLKPGRSKQSFIDKNALGSNLPNSQNFLDVDDSGDKKSICSDVSVESLSKANIDPDSISQVSTNELISNDKSEAIPQRRTLSEGEDRVPSIKLGSSHSSESFVIVTDSEIAEAAKVQTSPIKKIHLRPQEYLREGFKWQRQLVFRSKLTMHTAFDRKDNSEPAAVTALATSRDHKTVYVGDGRGRVYSWSVPDQPGRVIADHWVKDEGVDSCKACGVKFSFSERRHHCRNCGQLFCSRCSRFESEISRLRIVKPVRVCQKCYQSLKGQTPSDPAS